MIRFASLKRSAECFKTVPLYIIPLLSLPISCSPAWQTTKSLPGSGFISRGDGDEGMNLIGE